MTSVESHIKVGERVETRDNYRGTCRYVGPVEQLGTGLFVGIELDEFIEDGNNGSIDKIQYFNCMNGHGQFVSIEHATKIEKYMNGYLHQDEDEDMENDAMVNHRMETNLQFINSAELDIEESSKSLNRKFLRRKSQFELEEQHVVPSGYFNDPISTTSAIQLGHETVSSTLADWLPRRKSKEQLESSIVPIGYFQEPFASTKGKQLVKNMISENLEMFHRKRPTLDQLQMKNIMPKEFIAAIEDPNVSLSDAQKLQIERQDAMHQALNEKVRRRPTITDLGDMHIIPHDYLDNLLEDAVSNHQRKQSRMDHVQDRLQKHLPQPVAETLAQTLVASVQDDTDNDEDDDIDMNVTFNKINNDNDEDADEWQISFVYEPMQSFIPMNPAQKNEVTNKLERRLSLRPSKQQIEYWGVVPPQYFESPVWCTCDVHISKCIQTTNRNKVFCAKHWAERLLWTYWKAFFHKERIFIS